MRNVKPGGWRPDSREAPAKSARRIFNEDIDEGIFNITLTGTGLSFTTDTDGDGLN